MFIKKKSPNFNFPIICSVSTFGTALLVHLLFTMYDCC